MYSAAPALYPQIPESVICDLMRLRIPVHLTGYRQLCVAILLFSKDPGQILCGELYPAVAKALGYADWRAIEYSIRRVILCAWAQRNSEVWEEFFPGVRKPPSNKQFIATLAMRIK